ncbi:MAG: hypothetical protein A2741_01055 [Candidatus Zambryskibacteria bacterium RIFCSPHIGHO2_01_FULL_43_27]|uniref:DNA 3'-5' helicase n=1 Tax=Candidatus Zambryskibacteria bacterium RIFCSPLOWO2_01_FULL_43_17 TaxID=1802760 RepID=A0A1G2U6H7_9BACT|nr:MAG: hypothetical protein A2741_01055 [Candidatus Zambryskibacteria bacterium RIFCSPHIGHO2_01_FULL_43_27]OHB00089.1 MAG: hypothetical protein A3E93_02050 [Candidatus Zambryskibacteria bacterium RIFCSPHIGHO2_12_FULL_43_12b]OHB04620.1 MAG: hypothetical protein A2920_01635 [Candidatus Zambryskibacteria bacterium RIFCSPLOWO2_01_FULL_43_17]
MPNLNPAQKEAVNTVNGPLLILAGAGAGKTKTIVERIANLVRGGVNPSSILAITFTNKAANEMKERVERALKEDAVLNKPITIEDLPFVSTFHSLGVTIIKENARLLGLPRYFKIFDQGDSKQAIKEAIKAEELDPKEYEPGRFLSIISREKGNAVGLDEYETTVADDFLGSLVAKIWRRYEKILREEKALDFDDLLFYTLRLLEKKEVRDSYHRRWQYIHVDEYQDTNVVQYKIANLLSSKDRNICVVGDIDQNIYSWRGAKLKNILDFERDYPNAKVVILEENYRSTQNILHAANEIIKKNEFRREKKLFTRNPTGEALTLFEGYDETSEAEFVATKAQGLIAGGTAPEEIAVLYRANFQSRALEEAFLAYGIRYQILGTKFFERKEVKDVLAYIRLALEPESLSDLKRVINVPTRGIGKVSLLKIMEGKSGELPKAARESYEKFQDLINKIRHEIDTRKTSEAIRFTIKESGIEESFSQGGGEDEERLLNVRELVTIASRYDSREGTRGIEEFLTNASLQSDQDELTEAPDGVKLMTVHAAKGLEFDYVFITGLEDGLFPHERIVAGPKNEDDEEERRLFYVALTRARKKIFLSYSQIRTLFGNKQVNIPSEFIYDIPEEIIVREEGTYGLLRKPLYKIDF